MLNIGFLACIKVELWDLTLCIVVNGEKFRSDLDIYPTKPNIDFFRDICIYNNVFQFHVPSLIIFRVTVQKTHTYTRTRTHTRTHTHKDSDEHSIVVFCKNATIIKKLS